MFDFAAAHVRLSICDIVPVAQPLFLVCFVLKLDGLEAAVGGYDDLRLCLLPLDDWAVTKHQPLRQRTATYLAMTGYMLPSTTLQIDQHRTNA